MNMTPTITYDIYNDNYRVQYNSETKTWTLFTSYILYGVLHWTDFASYKSKNSTVKSIIDDIKASGNYKEEDNTDTSI